MNPIKNFFNKNPAVFLLVGVYLFFLPILLSYDHAWTFPEDFFFKRAIVLQGVGLQWHDLKLGLDWVDFEGTHRITRPLSSYFEILDTKFRCWLWHYIMPHPSLSLTWIFSLILTPLMLYRLMRYWKISINTSMAMVAFYLMTPAVMSYAVMLFRPAKPMANFFIVLCLYSASLLQKNFLDRGKPVPMFRYLCFWAISVWSMYWDETMWVIVPAFLVLFPRVAFSRQSYLLLWLALPFITVLFYLKIIPYLTVLAGYDFADVLKFKGYLRQLHDFPLEFIKDLPGNTKSLILDTMGILVPDVFKASLWIKACCCMCVAGWGVLSFYLLKAKWQWDRWTFFLGTLILLFNYLMTILVGFWGPFYYGAFWSIFFVIWLGLWIERSQMPRFVLPACFLPIFLSMFYSFSAINTVYKLNHYYPYKTIVISRCFQGIQGFYDADQKPHFSGEELKWYVKAFWLASKQKTAAVQLSSLPRELYWVILELEPGKPRTRYELFSENTHIPTLIFDFR